MVVGLATDHLSWEYVFNDWRGVWKHENFLDIGLAFRIFVLRLTAVFVTGKQLLARPSILHLVESSTLIQA